MEILLTRGDDAVALLRDGGYESQWRRLHAECPWSTGNQSPDFLLPWYFTYLDVREPLLVFTRSADGQLAALLPLAVDRDSGGLSVAAMPQIEYGGWLSNREMGGDFILGAIDRLKTDFAQRSLAFHYLPFGAPVDWLARVPELGGVRVWSEPHRRPVLQLDDPARIRAALNKKSNKSRFNRLKRMGEVEILRLHTRADLEPVLESMKAYCDLRQGAVNGSCPFSDDSRKEVFHLAMLDRPEGVYCTAMLVGGRLAALLYGVRNPDSVSIALLVISPFFSRHSPGKFLVYETALMLAEDGLKFLDITPGGDPWKDRFADSYDSLLDLRLDFKAAPSAAERGMKAGVDLLRHTLRRIGVSPERVQYFMGRLRRIRPRHVVAFVDRLRRRVWETREARIYSVDAREFDVGDLDTTCARDRVQDLLAYSASEQWRPREGFLRDACAKLERGEHVYTHVDSGRLLHYGWMLEEQDKSWFPEIGTHYEYPKGSAVLYEFFTEPAARGRGLYKKSMRRMLADLAANESVEQVYISVDAANLPSRAAIESVGFHYRDSLVRRVRWGSVDITCGATGS